MSKCQTEQEEAFSIKPPAWNFRWRVYKSSIGPNTVRLRIGFPRTRFLKQCNQCEARPYSCKRCFSIQNRGIVVVHATSGRSISVCRQGNFLGQIVKILTRRCDGLPVMMVFAKRQKYLLFSADDNGSSTWPSGNNHVPAEGHCPNRNLELQTFNLRRKQSNVNEIHKKRSELFSCFEKILITGMHLLICRPNTMG